jgi:hypothetical protein
MEHNFINNELLDQLNSDFEFANFIDEITTKIKNNEKFDKDTLDLYIDLDEIHNMSEDMYDYLLNTYDGNVRELVIEKVFEFTSDHDKMNDQGYCSGDECILTVYPYLNIQFYNGQELDEVCKEEYTSNRGSEYCYINELVLEYNMKRHVKKTVIYERCVTQLKKDLQPTNLFKIIFKGCF